MNYVGECASSTLKGFPFPTPTTYIVYKQNEQHKLYRKTSEFAWYNVISAGNYDAFPLCFLIKYAVW